MKLTCALCGRDTEPAVMIGNRAIGPKCAAKAGLLPAKPVNTKRVVVFTKNRAIRPKDLETLDLFG